MVSALRIRDRLQFGQCLPKNGLCLLDIQACCKYSNDVSPSVDVPQMPAFHFFFDESQCQVYPQFLLSGRRISRTRFCADGLCVPRAIVSASTNVFDRKDSSEMKPAIPARTLTRRFLSCIVLAASRLAVTMLCNNSPVSRGAIATSRTLWHPNCGPQRLTGRITRSVGGKVPAPTGLEMLRHILALVHSLKMLFGGYRVKPEWPSVPLQTPDRQVSVPNR